VCLLRGTDWVFLCNSGYCKHRIENFLHFYLVLSLVAVEISEALHQYSILTSVLKTTRAGGANRQNLGTLKKQCSSENGGALDGKVLSLGL
jgi:hypothetical protein